MNALRQSAAADGPQHIEVRAAMAKLGLETGESCPNGVECAERGSSMEIRIAPWLLCVRIYCFCSMRHARALNAGVRFRFRVNLVPVH